MIFSIVIEVTREGVFKKIKFRILKMCKLLGLVRASF